MQKWRFTYTDSQSYL